MQELDLRRPIYKKTAAFGHFGRTEPGVHLGTHRQGSGSPLSGRACSEPVTPPPVENT